MHGQCPAVFARFDGIHKDLCLFDKDRDVPQPEDLGQAALADVDVDPALAQSQSTGLLIPISGDNETIFFQEGDDSLHEPSIPQQRVDGVGLLPKGLQHFGNRILCLIQRVPGFIA